MKHFLSIVALLALLVACQDGGEKFEAQGTVDGAGNQVLYLEAVTLRGIETVDSVKLKDDGRFALHGDRPQSPEFYRLRLGDQSINFCIDSTETVTFTAQAAGFSSAYQVEGSEACEQMRQLALMQLQLRRDVDSIARRDGMSPSQRQEAANARIEAYKNSVAQQYVIADPGSPVAYYALFQTFGGQTLFDAATNQQDIRMFAAVATAWDALYPDAPRTQRLHDTALRGMAAMRLAQRQTLPIDYDSIDETGIIDMTLCDPDGTEHTLSELKGQVVLLDFTAFASPDFSRRTIAMQELYGKYHSRGFEIFQVSVDQDVHLWQMRASALPWVGVHLGDKSDLLLLYQVSQVPTYFLIDRGSNLIDRSDNIKDLAKAIEALL